MGLRAELPVVGVVAAGGALGASARYGAGLLWPTPQGAFPWTTFTVNTVGCALLGALMVLVTERPTEWSTAPPHPLLRPFLGTGFCGGFTTFSTYSLETERLLSAGDPTRGLLYLGGTLVTALAAVLAGVAGTRAVRARAARGRVGRA
ncbi:fluoride efflux transporter CrcB [Streptomyces sp. NPDC006553]|uniref:fluoride efflux transporter CrcB n=1 Tax=unclassified Streptomyces TaxID=2593676 RepID=UPI00225C0C8E|nr:fluoride efflux transporter CrcB [Streptomyces sp. NBC_00233]MCX5226312.1 fluoride efflux transporter CrcB [Streptomyces sp. NBC_00233]